jgi:hypothetical protein
MANAEDTPDHDTSVTSDNSPGIGSSKAVMNGLAGLSATDPPILNGHPSANADKPGILERRASKLEPLKEVTNTNGVPTPAPSTPPASSKSATSHVFKIPPLPIHKASLPLDDTPLHAKTPLPLESNGYPKPRRWSASTMAPSPTRRNSFPRTRKDGLEDLRALKAEAKLAKENSAAASIINGTTRPKNSIPGLLTGSIFTAGGDGYFTIKPDSRSRSTTTPGILPTPGVIPRRSYIAENRPLVTPRLEPLRRDSARQEGLPSTLWDYLMIEMENFDVQGVEEYKKERLSNFLTIPQTFEKVSTL